MNTRIRKNGKMRPRFESNDEGYAFPSLNHVAIAGRLVETPPLRYTKKNVAVTNFIIESQPEHELLTNYTKERCACQVSIVAWSTQAVECTKQLKKGDPILVFGELQSMPNSEPRKGFFPIQVKAHHIQLLKKFKFPVTAKAPEIQQPDGVTANTN